MIKDQLQSGDYTYQEGDGATEYEGAHRGFNGIHHGKLQVRQNTPNRATLQIVGHCT